MDKIKQLDAFEALKIAAGEVVERPADMLKELVENAIDAAARTISIYTQDAGHTMLRVVDDGCGMSYRDAHACIQRHATSKIKTIDDLSTLTSFGFRGEGLASIAAVAKLELVTKLHSAQLATALCFEQSVCVQEQEIAAQTGTDISVRDLFYALPARKKFLRKAEAEWRLLQQFFQAFCLSHLNIHFKLFAENKLVHNCPPAQTLNDRCQQLWGAELGPQLATVTSQQNKVMVNGVISMPTVQRYNRQQIFIFVNQRWIKNGKLSQALLRAYAGSLQPERYPVAILLLQVPPHEVDINVHPRKEEVTFLYPRLIEQTIKETAHQALQKQMQTFIHASSTKNTEQSSHFLQSDRQATNFLNAQTHERFIHSTTQLVNGPIRHIAQQNNEPASPLITQEFKKFNQSSDHFFEQTSQQLIHEAPHFAEQNSLIGVLKNTYILLEQTDGLLMIDQHAAHERILYELFTKRCETVSAIELLFKPTVSLEPADVLMLAKQQELFRHHHIIFEILEDVGIRIDAVPVHLKQINWQEFFARIVETFREESDTSSSEIAQRLHHALCAQMACKAAVKAGDVLTQTEINRLLEDLNKCPERLSCPHGRPVSWLLTKSEILKQFRRTS